MNDDVFVCDLTCVGGRRSACARIDMGKAVRMRSDVVLTKWWRDMVFVVSGADLPSMHTVLGGCVDLPSTHMELGRLAAAAVATVARVARVAEEAC